MKLITKDGLETLKEIYTIGSVVELVSMDDPYTNIVVGSKGVVTDIDDTGSIFVRWENGSNLGVVYGVDRIKLIQEK